MRQSDLEYIGEIDGRHCWTCGGYEFYWTPGANVVTSDLAGVIRFCRVTLAPRQSRATHTIKTLTRTDAKRAIVGALS
ncbi:hypothetical protein CE456_00750 (plasmid) [Aeromonas salmonicida]|nr:hypothetical protein CE456_00750 [Aeromonas salmonicida]